MNEEKDNKTNSCFEPVRYIGKDTANIDYHHGQLRSVAGVHSFQVLRANRAYPELAEGYGWTYNHQPFLAYWNGKFYIQYLSNPVSEHEGMGQTLLVTSEDGIIWGVPQVVFPPYKLPDGSWSIMHQRMGFYVSGTGRLLTLAFYGLVPHPEIVDMPNDGKGIGRVVREAYRDGSYGPIYFIRYNKHAGWNENNTLYPFYKESQDSGFVDACDELLEDRLMTLQWWEEDRSSDGFYRVEGCKALSYYHLEDGKTVGLWKWSKAAVSEDEGMTWSEVADVPSIVTAGGKVWGQRISDGNYVLIYNPSTDNDHRWPLAIISSRDGISFDNLLTVAGDAAPMRYRGSYKSYGMNYVRGIAEGNGIPPDGSIWITYSMNKEDIWVSKIPVPIISGADSPIYDIFDEMEPGKELAGWNIYSPQWAPVLISRIHGSRNLKLTDSDPADYAKAERVFPESRHVTLKLKVMAGQNQWGQLYIETTDGKGAVPGSLVFDSDGWIKVRYGGSCGLKKLIEYLPELWYEIEMDIDAHTHQIKYSFNGKRIGADAWFIAPVMTVEKLVLRTGNMRRQPDISCDMDVYGCMKGEDMTDCCQKVPEAIYFINFVKTINN